MTLKFMDYFTYALVEGGQMNSTDEGTCFDECGSGKWSDKCCATVKLYQPRSDIVDYQYHCINKNIAGADMLVQLDDFEVSLSCEDKYSGSKQLVATITAGALALIVSLF